MTKFLKAAAGAALAFAAVEASAAPLSSSFAYESNSALPSHSMRANPVMFTEGLVSTVYSEGFEDFVPGGIDGQFGWSSGFPPNHNIDFFPSEGLQNLAIQSDGSLIEDLLFSPNFGDTGAGDFVTMSLDFASTLGSTYIIATQSPSQGLVNTQILIDPFGSLFALEDDGFGGAVFTDTGATTAGAYDTLEIEVARADGTFTVDLNGFEIFAGQGFATLLEQIVFISVNDGTGDFEFLDIDNINVTNDSRAVVPVPAAAPLFAAGMAIAALRRRKKSA